MGLASVIAARFTLVGASLASSVCHGIWLCSAHAAPGSSDSAPPVDEYAARRDLLVRESAESELRSWEASADWRSRITALDVRAWQYEPTIAALAWSCSPVATRLGLRFSDSRLENPAAIGPLLARLAWGGESSEHRVALAEFLARTHGDWSATLILMWPDELDPSVRATIVAIGRFAPQREAEAMVRLGFGDGEARVRQAAVQTVPWLAANEPLHANVLGTLTDADAVVRAEAARASGLLAIHDAWTPLIRLLSDPDARVRFQAIRALQRLDAVDAASLPQVERLKQDSDLRVQKAANEMGL